MGEGGGGHRQHAADQTPGVGYTLRRSPGYHQPDLDGVRAREAQPSGGDSLGVPSQASLPQPHRLNLANLLRVVAQCPGL